MLRSSWHPVVRLANKHSIADHSQDTEIVLPLLKVRGFVIRSVCYIILISYFLPKVSKNCKGLCVLEGRALQTEAYHKFLSWTYWIIPLSALVRTVLMFLLMLSGRISDTDSFCFYY